MITIKSVELVPETPGVVKVTGTSVMGVEVSRLLKAPSVEAFESGIGRWQSGTLIQIVFPTWSADDREFLISGVADDAFDSMFADEDEEDVDAAGDLDT